MCLLVSKIHSVNSNMQQEVLLSGQTCRVVQLLLLVAGFFEGCGHRGACGSGTQSSGHNQILACAHVHQSCDDAVTLHCIARPLTKHGLSRILVMAASLG